MSRRALTLAAASVLAVVLVVIGSVLRVPYVILVPTQPIDVLSSHSDYVKGQGPVLTVTPASSAHPTDGHLWLTLVGENPREPTLWSALSGWLDAHKTVVPRSVQIPPSQTSQQYQQRTKQQMIGSQQAAINAAELLLGLAKVDLVVASVERTAPASAVLRRGDVITAVDGSRVTSVTDLRSKVDRIGAHHPMGLTVVRNGTAVTVHTTTVSVTQPGLGARPAIGIALEARVRLPASPHVSIGINTDQVGGPSGGLMLALGVYDALTPGSLTGGKSVAGTGEIDNDGTISETGAVQEKVVGARAAGAQYFFAPKVPGGSECQDAVAAAPKGLRVIPVSTLREAVADMALIRDGRPLPTC